MYESSYYDGSSCLAAHIQMATGPLRSLIDSHFVALFGMAICLPSSWAVFDGCRT